MDLGLQLLQNPNDFINRYGTDIFYNIIQNLDYSDIIIVCEKVSLTFIEICQTERFQKLIRSKLLKEFLNFIIYSGNIVHTTLENNYDDYDFYYLYDKDENKLYYSNKVTLDNSNLISDQQLDDVLDYDIERQVIFHSSINQSFPLQLIQQSFPNFNQWPGIIINTGLDQSLFLVIDISKFIQNI